MQGRSFAPEDVMRQMAASRRLEMFWMVRKGGVGRDGGFSSGVVMVKR